MTQPAHSSSCMQGKHLGSPIRIRSEGRLGNMSDLVTLRAMASPRSGPCQCPPAAAPPERPYSGPPHVAPGDAPQQGYTKRVTARDPYVVRFSIDRSIQEVQPGPPSKAHCTPIFQPSPSKSTSIPASETFVSGVVTPSKKHKADDNPTFLSFY